MNSLMRTNLLAQHGDCIVGQADGVEGIQSIPGLHGGVGRLASEEDAPFDIGEHLYRGHTGDAAREEVLGPGMRHETGGGVAVGTAGDEMKLATAALLGGRAQQADPARDGGLPQCLCSAEKGGEAGGCNQVVSTGMANARQSVVLGIEDDETAARAILGGEGSLEAIGVRCDVETKRLEQGDEIGVSFVFLVGKLGLTVNLNKLPLNSAASVR